MATAKMFSLPWQCDLTGPQQRLEYLFNAGCFSDIIIKCNGGFSYNLHRVVLAMCSPVFESMLFNTLASSNHSLYLEDDPGILKFVFKHCYSCELQCDDIHVVLDIFKIADKYIIHDLKNKCIKIVQNLIKPENFKTIYEFTARHGYNDLRDSCIRFLQQDSNITIATAALMWFSQNSPSDLHMPVFAVNKLIFDTWRNPKSVEPFDDLVTLPQSNCCNSLQEFAGQVSGDVIKYIPGPLRSTVTVPQHPSYAPMLKLSIQSGYAKEVIMALHERYNTYGPEDIGIHITNEDLPSVCHELSKLPCYNCHNCKCKGDDDEFELDYVCDCFSGRVTLYFSDLTKENLNCLYFLIYNLQPECDKEHKFVNAYMFPSCKLTKEDFGIFGEHIFSQDEYFILPSCGYMWMYSPYIEMKDEEDLYHFTRKSMNLAGMKIGGLFPYTKLMSSDNGIPGW